MLFQYASQYDSSTVGLRLPDNLLQDQFSTVRLSIANPNYHDNIDYSNN